MSQPEALYRLQEIDLNIRRMQNRLKEISEILADDAVLQAAQAQVTAAQDKLTPLKKRVRQLEDEIQSNEEKARASEQQLYSGTIKNPKEMQDMQQEIESLKRWHGELENMLLDTMLDAEAAEAGLSEATTNFSSVSASRGDEQRHLLDEQAELHQHIEQAKERRQQVLTEIAPENLKIYNTMKVRKNHQPVAIMTGNTCSVCGVAQTIAIEREVRQGIRLVKCSNCERILVSG
jgi:uncharacterized protein